MAEQIIDGAFAAIPRNKPNLDAIQNARIIAHRGAHDNANGIIENTLQAFALARDAGCWGLEFDIHATADQVLVVNHDPTLTRLWGHDVAIADINFNELRSLEPRIPSLIEVIHEFSSMHFFIELKSPFDAENALIDALHALSPCKDYHLLALDKPTFHGLSHVPKQALLLVAVHNNVSDFCEYSIKEGYGGVMGSYLLLTNKKIQQLKAVNQAIGVGFVDSKFNLYRELNRGISWIFTNQAVFIGQQIKQLLTEQ